MASASTRRSDFIDSRLGWNIRDDGEYALFTAELCWFLVFMKEALAAGSTPLNSSADNVLSLN